MRDCHAAPSVHPRVCGERPVLLVLMPVTPGSSPRVRGTLHGLACRAVRLRFIPACAGNADGCCKRISISTVHPRVCGERWCWCSAMGSTGGSSPRVRGTRTGPASHDMPLRFIPACAGNAIYGSSSRSLSTVHPRVCGERTPGNRGTAMTPGSSPRVRGTPEAVEAERERTRFIPACAGNAHGSIEKGEVKSVHPRVCGERSAASCFARVQGGSSPRVRGTHRQSKGRNQRERFIPACAGNASAGKI